MLRTCVLAGAFLLPAIAVAQPIQGLYVGAGVGANFAGTFRSSEGDTRIYTNTGPVGLASVGWGFGNGLRAEIEGSYRANGISGISTLRSGIDFKPLDNASGTAATYAAMANLAYDIPFHPFGLPVQPYVGGGLGYGWLNFGNANGGGLSTFTNGTVKVGPVPNVVSFGSAGSFAYQAIAGIAVPVQFLPGLQFTLEYRFFGMHDAKIPVTRTNAVGDRVNGVLAADTVDNKFGVADNAVLVGFRYAFGVAPAPTPAPAPIPIAQPARSFLVFFDWDKATLTDRARQIVAEAAASATKVQYTRIEVNGYTDTSGSAKYNMGLSIRRAEAVAAELVHDGVPKAAISIQGFGQTRLLVPTADGVREPQNRRVEIIIR